MILTLYCDVNILKRTELYWNVVTCAEAYSTVLKCSGFAHKVPGRLEKPHGFTHGGLLKPLMGKSAGSHDYYVYLSMCAWVYVSIWLFVGWFVCLLACLFVCLFV